MLARGVLCRLAAEVPKQSTHELPRISHLLQSGLASRNGTPLPTICALSRAYKASLLGQRRSYATENATKPTTKVKRDVKKAAAKKPTKKAATKAPKRKTVVKKKAKPKKKAAPKKTSTKKVPTAEQKEKENISQHKKKALRPPTTRTAISGWHAFISELATGSKNREDANQAVKAAGSKFKNLTPAEKEHYNHLANEKSAAKKTEYDAWIRSHTPEEIRAANVARAYLRRKVKAGVAISGDFRPLRDDRLPKKPITAFFRFANERRASGDMKGIAPREVANLCANEWKALSASEKKKYQDEYLAARAAYNAKSTTA